MRKLLAIFLIFPVFGVSQKLYNPACLVRDLQAKIDAQLYLDFSEENTPTFVIG